MTSKADLRAAADENLVFAFSLLVPHAVSPQAAVRRFGGAVACVTGVASPFFNPVTIAGRAIAAGDIRDAVGFVRDRGIEPSIQVREDLDAVVAAVAADLGFVPDDWRMPGMVLAPIPAVIAPGPLELETVTVIDDVTLDRWYEATGSPGMRTLITPSFAKDPSVRLVVGLVDGDPVCHAAAVASDRTLGIYAVGTLERARQRGYGRAVTWASIAAGRAAWQSEIAILQSSEMGVPVYRSMGFVELTRYAIYEPAKGPADRPQG
jgi:hypothetical protein